VCLALKPVVSRRESVREMLGEMVESCAPSDVRSVAMHVSDAWSYCVAIHSCVAIPQCVGFFVCQQLCFKGIH